MSLSLLWRRASGVARIDLANPLVIAVAGVASLSLVGGVFMLGVMFGQRALSVEGARASIASVELAQHQLAELRLQLQERVDVLAARIGQVNAHVVRLDALGKRVAELADLDSREFDFSIAPSSGGPETEGVAAQAPEISRLIDDVEGRLAQRGSQLDALETLLLQRELRAQLQPEGRPVERGFQSSGFGWRPDPFTGLSTMHRGIDFAGNLGDPVIAVGGGIVTFAGIRDGYGWVVDITHGDGYVTRYGHNRKLLVKVGDAVTRGQRIAEMGSTGRSTGPHVHFEVLRNGVAVDPLSYIAG